jgi:hypothetical protein
VADIIQAGPNLEEEPYGESYVYNNCDVPLAIVSDHLLSGGSSITDTFVVGDDGGISRSGNAEASEAEDESDDNDTPVAIGWGQRKRVAVWRYQGHAWEEH